MAVVCAHRSCRCSPSGGNEDVEDGESGGGGGLSAHAELDEEACRRGGVGAV